MADSTDVATQVPTLHWIERSDFPGDWYAMTSVGFYYVACFKERWMATRGDKMVASDESDVDEAKSRAQEDFEVMMEIGDIDADQAKTTVQTSISMRFQIEWIAGARPPVHPAPMTGRMSYPTFEKAIAHMKSQAADAIFVSLVEHTTVEVSVDRSADVRAILGDCAPAPSERVIDPLVLDRLRHFSRGTPKVYEGEPFNMDKVIKADIRALLKALEPNSSET